MAMYRWVPRALAVLAVGAAVSAVAERASACSLDPCPSSVRLPPMPYLPGNLVYFQIIGDDPPEIALRTAEGEPIAASIRTIGGDRVFAPEQPIAEGTQLVLDYSIQCVGGPPQTLAQTFEFMTSIHSEMAFNPGRLEVEEIGIRYPGRDNETSFVRVRYWPGESNGDTSALMSHSYTVDGLPVWLQLLNGGNLVEVPVACRPQVVDAVRDSCGSLYTLPPGVHTVELSTHVVGATTQPEPVRLQVDVQCPDADAADSSSDDGPAPSTPEQEMVGPTEPSSDAALPDGLSPDSLTYGDFEGGGDPLPEPAAAPAASSNGGGCALGVGGAPARRGGLLALVAAFVLGRARRRSPPSAR
jgi:hypothetical protein